MATSWTPHLCWLVLLLLCANEARAAAIAAKRTHSAEQGSPLVLFVLRAMSPAGTDGPGGPAAAPLLAESPPRGAKQAPALAQDRSDHEELDAFKKAVLDLSSPRASDGTFGDTGDTVFLRAAKRQVRYHQCYFNPISCFG